MNHKTKILIVEDESIVAVDIRNILQNKLGYEVAGMIRSGEEAIQAAKNLAPDLILMDIVLDGKLTGIEAAAIIKEKYNIPIIYLTAFSDKETLASAKITEPYGYVLKPLDVKVLHSAIEMALYKALAEKIIKENEERYKMLIENSPVAIGVHCEGIIVFINSAGARLFGASSAEEIIGKPVMQFIHQDYKGILQERIHPVRPMGMGLEGIAEKLLRLDGSVIDVETAAMPTIYNDKPAVEVVIRDITELKKKDRIQQVLLKILQIINLETSSEKYFEVLYSSIKEFIVIDMFLVAAYNRNTGVLAYHFCRNEGDQKEMISGLIEHTLNKFHSVVLNQSEIENLFSDYQVTRYTNPLIRWMGISKDIDEENALVIAAGMRNTEVYFGRDEVELFELFVNSLSKNIITRLMNDENAKTVSHIEELNSVKNKFFSSLSHEIKNNFNSVLGYTDVLRNDFDALKPAEIKSAIDSLYNTSRNIYSLIDKLLKFSKNDSLTFKPNMKGLSLQDIISKEILSVKTLTDKKNIEFHYSGGEDVMIYCDEEVLSTIFQNLILQTINFSSKGSRIYVKLSDKNEFVEMSVSDSGTGIEEYLIKNLFITRDTAPENNIVNNKGIGFILTKEILRKCGGDLQVKNDPGEGSEFKLTFPAYKAGTIYT